MVIGRAHLAGQALARVMRGSFVIVRPSEAMGRATEIACAMCMPGDGVAVRDQGAGGLGPDARRSADSRGPSLRAVRPTARATRKLVSQEHILAQPHTRRRGVSERQPTMRPRPFRRGTASLRRGLTRRLRVLGPNPLAANQTDENEHSSHVHHQQRHDLHASHPSANCTPSKRILRQSVNGRTEPELLERNPVQQRAEHLVSCRYACEQPTCLAFVKLHRNVAVSVLASRAGDHQLRRGNPAVPDHDQPAVPGIQAGPNRVRRAATRPFPLIIKHQPVGPGRMLVGRRAAAGRVSSL